MRRFAPAKVNLALHVTGRRDNGFHLLDSLVVFAGVGDWVEVKPADKMALHVTGPRAAGVPTDERNLVWRAAEWAGRPAEIILEKHLPHAGGIGGGSADAAAVLRALNAGTSGAEALGADVPVCLRGRPTRMSGIGEVLDDVPPLPPMWLVLVNAGVEVPTGSVFSGLQRVENAELPTPEWNGFNDFIEWLKRTRNDLEASAMDVAPIIEDVLERLLETDGCALARMSGSGGTCFGIFEEERTAQATVAAMPEAWWSVAAEILPSDQAAG